MEASADKPLHPLPHHVAVIGAAGGLGQGILRICRADGIAFTAIVRSRPERIVNLPSRSKVAVGTSLADRAALSNAFLGGDVVVPALGGAPTGNERSGVLAGKAAAGGAALV